MKSVLPLLILIGFSLGAFATNEIKNESKFESIQKVDQFEIQKNDEHWEKKMQRIQLRGERLATRAERGKN